MRIFDIIVNAIFPNKCISCTEIIDREEYLCDYCYSKIERVDYYKVCKRCGGPKNNCDCQNRVFHFNSLVAPFYNTDVAQSAMYRFKFNKIIRFSNFFAWEMAKAVRTVYNEDLIDGIVYVPMSTFKQLRRGFNQAEELAKRLSQILDIDIYYDVLSAKHSNIYQHEMSLKDRFNNVKGIYSYNKKVTGKNILLVDDIKTTGATIDECAKQLLLAGANKVYCVTGLISKQKINTERKKTNGS